MNKLDKKQIPQFAALCVLSAGVFGYFVMKIVTPSPAAAGTRPHPAGEGVQASAALPAPVKPAAAGKSGAAPEAAQDADGKADEAPAPTPGMRDPFVIGYVDPATVSAPAAPTPAPAPVAVPAKAAAARVASIREVAPTSVGTPALPFGLKGFPAPGTESPAPGAALPLPAAPRAAAPPPAPAWTVTGVLQSAAGQMAVLRDGDARRIVRTGDSVDSLYRVVAVTRSAVVLRHGTTFYHLTLGASSPATAAPTRPAAVPAFVPAPTPPAPPVGAPREDAFAPAAPPAGLEAGLARMVQGALLMARSYMAPAQIRTDTCFALAQPPIQEDAQAPLAAVPFDLSRDVYGPASDGVLQWRSVVALPALDAADLGGAQPHRFI